MIPNRVGFLLGMIVVVAGISTAARLAAHQYALPWLSPLGLAAACGLAAWACLRMERP